MVLGTALFALTPALAGSSSTIVLGKEPVPAKSNLPSAKPQRVPGTRMTIVPPPGFAQASNFAGYIEPDSNASLMLTEISAPFSKLSASYQAAPMEKRGMILAASKSESLGNLLGLAIEFKQSMYGVNFNKYARLFGDENCCYLVLASVAEDTDPSIIKRLKEAMYSIAIDTTAKAPSLDEGLNFSISDGSILKKSRRLQNALIYKPLAASTDKPDKKTAVLVVAPSIAAIKIDNPAEFALVRLKNIETMTDLKVDSERDMVIDGLKGREIKATAKEIKTGEQSYVYQAMLFDTAGYYYIVQGLCPMDNKAAMDKEFAAITSTFKLKKATNSQ